MAFYESIAEHYDHIFPLNPAQVDFVLGCLEDQDKKRILDVGCGTGNLCIALGPHFKEVIGIDPDEEMLGRAMAKLSGHREEPIFQKGGMLDLLSHKEWQGVDAVLCFGNTLVHLGSEEEILDFLVQAKQLLIPGGNLIIQIINYDRIFKQNIDGLPTIENDEIKFVRNYHYTEAENSLDFETILTLKKSGKVIRNNVQLFPIRSEQLLTLLKKAGFIDILFYGNFKKEAFSIDSIPLVIEAR